jgi:hypothetical protein
VSICAAVFGLLNDTPPANTALAIKCATIEVRELSAFAAFSGCAPRKPGAIPDGTII